MTTLKRNYLKAGMLLLAAFSAAALSVGHVQAKDWPSGSVTIVVPYPAGGNSDALARILAPELGEKFGVSFIVENRAGASGTIGAASVAHGRPNGSEFLLGSSADQIITPSLYPSITYDPGRDLTVVSGVSRDALLLAADSDLPLKSWEEIVKWGKENPLKLKVANSGTGTSTHLGAVLLGDMAGVEFTHVPYRGAAQAIIDTVAGRTELVVTSPISSASQREAGGLKAVALAAKQRSPLFPDIPTFSELGLEYEAMSWYVLVAATATDPEIVQRMGDAVREILQKKEVVEKINKLGVEPDLAPVDELTRLLSEERVFWAELIKKNNISIE